jgi:hypothetical protein
VFDDRAGSLDRYEGEAPSKLVTRYLYRLSSSVCKCGHRKGDHPYGNGTLRPCRKDSCECVELVLEEWETEAVTIRDAAEKLKQKLDDVVYLSKSKL